MLVNAWAGNGFWHEGGDMPISKYGFLCDETCNDLQGHDEHSAGERGIFLTSSGVEVNTEPLTGPLKSLGPGLPV